MSDIVTHYGKNYNWIGYKNGNNPFTITLTESGSLVDLSGYVFTLNIRTPRGLDNKLQLTEGSGITNGGAAGTLAVELTEAQASSTLPRDLYFYVLEYRVDGDDYPLLQGSLSLSSETNPSSPSTSITIQVNMNGTSVDATVTMVNPANKVTTNRQIASYTLVLADAGKLIEMNVASANNLTVPPNSSVAFTIGTQILIAQYGAGQTTVVAGSGVTLRSQAGALGLSAQYAGATLIKIATNEWYLIGNII